MEKPTIENAEVALKIAMSSRFRGSKNVTEADLEEIDKLLALRQAKIDYARKIVMGLKEFTIDEITVLALNERNAKKKVMKLKK